MALVLFSLSTFAYEASDLIGKWQGVMGDLTVNMTYSSDGQLFQEIPELGFSATGQCEVTKIDAFSFVFNCNVDGTSAVVKANFVSQDTIVIFDQASNQSISMDRQ